MSDYDFISGLFWAGIIMGVLGLLALWGLYELLDWLVFSHINITWS